MALYSGRLNVFMEPAMDVIYADLSVSMSSFKKSPAEVLRNAGGKPVAVLNHDRLAFYMLPPRLLGCP